MVTASCRIGYDFSTPDGPLTMKLAETPSRSAGLIISVFGVASSPMASLLARKTRRLGGAPSVRGRAGSVKERRAGSGSASAAQPGRAADRASSRSRRRARPAPSSLDPRPAGPCPPRMRCPRCRLDLSDQDGIAGGRDEPELVELARRRGREAVRVETHPGFSVGLLAPGRGAPGCARRLAALPGPGGLLDHRGAARVAQTVELGLELADPLLHLGQLLLVLLEGLLRLRQLLARLGGCQRWRSPCPPGWASTVHETTQVTARRPAGGGAPARR